MAQFRGASSSFVDNNTIKTKMGVSAYIMQDVMLCARKWGLGPLWNLTTLGRYAKSL
jgi:hypothetical protein